MTAPLGVYVHWPFCKSKCPYCDFNSHVRDGVDQSRWRDALLKELDHAAREAPDRRVETMFFGGGTPSLMEPATVGAVIERVKALWDTAADVEITLEANPTSVEASRFSALAQAGVNRVSLGVQALDAASLRFLGREHSADEAIEAIATARRHFARYSFDLIYARPGQTEEAWAAELEQALALAWPDEHVELVHGTLDGRIVWPPRGSGGHGYDPCFQPKGDARTNAEMTEAEKNAISHRGRAFRRLVEACFK